MVVLEEKLRSAPASVFPHERALPLVSLVNLALNRSGDMATLRWLLIRFGWTRPLGLRLGSPLMLIERGLHAVKEQLLEARSRVGMGERVLELLERLHELVPYGHLDERSQDGGRLGGHLYFTR